MNTLEEIKKYKDLLDAGAITQEDFDAIKKTLLRTSAEPIPTVSPSETSEIGINSNNNTHPLSAPKKKKWWFWLFVVMAIIGIFAVVVVVAGGLLSLFSPSSPPNDSANEMPSVSEPAIENPVNPEPAKEPEEIVSTSQKLSQDEINSLIGMSASEIESKYNASLTFYQEWYTSRLYSLSDNDIYVGLPDTGRDIAAPVRDEICSFVTTTVEKYFNTESDNNMPASVTDFTARYEIPDDYSYDYADGEGYYFLEYTKNGMHCQILMTSAEHITDSDQVWIVEAWGQFGVVNTPGDVLNVRNSPNTNGDVIGKLNDGMQVAITSDLGDWYAIDFGGQVGYVKADFVNLSN
jgi:uncharacterized protein YgiM (DUF1202 family)